MLGLFVKNATSQEKVELGPSKRRQKHTQISIISITLIIDLRLQFTLAHCKSFKSHFCCCLLGYAAIYSGDNTHNMRISCNVRHAFWKRTICTIYSILQICAIFPMCGICTLHAANTHIQTKIWFGVSFFYFFCFFGVEFKRRVFFRPADYTLMEGIRSESRVSGQSGGYPARIEGIRAECDRRLNSNTLKFNPPITLEGIRQ